MAWTASGMYLVTWIDILDATQLAIDTSLTTHKVALYNNTETPNFSTESAYAATNEISGTGYSAGGTVVASPTTTESPTGTLMYDIADTSWTTATFSGVRGAKLYADALAGNNLIVGVNFGADYAVTSGTFTIQWAATGVLTLDLTP